MWVVKLGGSLQSFAGLRNWVELIAEAGGGRIVLVPGGGQFADAVREAQHTAGFDNRTAHDMALLAMEQYGLMLSGMAPNLVPVQSERQIRTVLEQGRVPVWMPHALASGSADITPDWTFTSDSLSLWLARRMEAEALLLIKSVAVPWPAAGLEALTAAEMIDRAFAPLAQDYAGRIGWLHCEETESLRAVLSDANPHGLTWVKVREEKRRPGPQPGARESGRLDKTLARTVTTGPHRNKKARHPEEAGDAGQ